MNRRIINLLVVAGEAEVAEALRRLLDGAPERPGAAFHLAHAAEAPEALAHLDASPVDAVLLDLDGIDDDGAAFVETLTERGVPVLLLAGAEDDAQAQRALALGAEDFLVKPALNTAWLRSALRHALARRPRQASGTPAPGAPSAEAEPSFRSVLEHHADGILVVDTEGTIRFANAMAETILGRGRPELEGALWGFPVLMSRAAELDITHRDGTQRVVEMYMLEIHWRQRPASLVLLRDITERKRAVQALRESEARFRTILDSSPDYIAAIDPGFHYIAFNEAYQHVMKDIFDTDVEVGASLEEVVSSRPKEQEAALAFWRRALKGETFTVQYELGDGNDGPIYELTFNPIRDEQGEIMGAAHIMRDISPRHRIERALRESEARFRTIINSSSEYIVAFDAQLNLIVFNGAYRELMESIFGVAPALGENIETVTASRPAEQQALVGFLKRALEGESFGQEYDLAEPPQQGRSYEATYNPLVDEDGSIIGVAVIGHEITERKQFRDALERTNEELQLFADVAGHDLREPLRSTRLYLELLVQRHGERFDAQATRLIQAALDGTQRMRELIDDLLAYTRLDHRGLRLAPVDTTMLVEKALADMQAAIREAGAEVTYEALPTVKADASQLKQVFQNLLSNAIKFRGEAPPRIHLSATQDEGVWKFAVADNGIGIDAVYAGRIFSMFERLNDRQSYAGTGIGLAICEKVIAHHGGHIWVESTPQAGATFYFTLPLEPTTRAELI